jgi:hypothetical protein
MDDFLETESEATCDWDWGDGPSIHPYERDEDGTWRARAQRDTPLSDDE